LNTKKPPQANMRTYATSELTLEWYLARRAKLQELGYGEMIEWSQNLKPVDSPSQFWAEFAWVVINSGMREQVARKIWGRVRPVVESGGSAADVFGHKGKAVAIDHVWTNRVRLLSEYQKVEDKLAWLESLPWIGSITKWHLAKNYGVDCAKPDRHLVRVAGAEGAHNLCARLARESGDRIATVDVVIWRLANLGLV
jgi:hypothetical protein